MISALSLPIDPYRVLGVAPGASLQEIRSAYRQKAKTYHPDTGGDEWAFRVVSQAYEFLSASRVARASRAEGRTRPSSPEKGDGFRSDSGTSAAEPPPEYETETIHPGEKDVAFDPNMVVEVEKLSIRYEPTDPWTLTEGTLDERFLSCSLNIAWPQSSLVSRAHAIPAVDAHLRTLVEVFEELRSLTPAVASNDRAQGDHFVGWLSYASINQASVAFRQLRATLHAHGFRLKPWTRDLIIPRDWR